MRLTKNLSRKEFSCKCGKCDFDIIDAELVIKLQDCVDHFSRFEPVYILVTSGNRCREHNETIEGAAKESQHIYGRAADFKLFYVRTRKQIEPKKVYNYLDAVCSVDRYGIGEYHNRVHFDTRSSNPWRKKL